MFWDFIKNIFKKQLNELEIYKEVFVHVDKDNNGYNKIENTLNKVPETEKSEPFEQNKQYLDFKQCVEYYENNGCGDNIIIQPKILMEFRQEIEDEDQYEKSAEDYYDEGQTYLEEEKYEDAIECFEKAINIDPNNANNYYWCGFAKYHNNQDEDAIKDFDKAIEINPQDPDYYYFRGHAKYFIEKYNEAIEDYKIGICKNPENLYDYYELIADAKKGLGDIVGAIEVCKYILGNDSNEENKIKIQEKITELEQLRAQNNVVSQEDFEELDQEIEDEDQYEKSAEDYYKEGRAYIEEEKYEEAVKCLEETIKLEPADADNYYWCALAKYNNGQNKEALKDLASGIKLLPEDICYYYNLRGDINKDLGKYEAARKNYLKAINEADEDFDVNEVEETLTEIDEIQAQEFFEKGQKYFDKDKYEKAIECFEESKNLAPDDDKYIYWCGKAKYWNEQDEEAIKDFNKAIELNPNSEEYYCYRGHAKFYTGKYEDAIEDYKIGISKKPEDFYNYYEFMADTKKELGDIAGAIEDYKYALENNPDEEEKIKIQEKILELETSQEENNINPQTSEEIEQIIANEDQSEDLGIDVKDTIGKKEFIETESTKIKEAEYYYNRGKIYYQKEHNNSAKNNFFKAIVYNSNISEYYYWFVLASINLGQIGDQQLEYIQKAINLDNTKPEYYELRGLIYGKRGAKEESKHDYEYAEELKKVNYKVCKQEYIINDDKEKSFLVDAGPGTGKTYTLIQKIKHLLESNQNEEEKTRIKEENILVLSHTNAAVDEIKTRLKDISNDTNIKVNKINIRTICSFVKFANTKYYEAYNRDKNEREKKYYVYEATESGFTRANNRLLNILNSDKNSSKTLLKEELKIKYLIVDEIQDAVDTVGEIICKLVEACVELNIPLALFGDKCQAIFDFDKNKNEYNTKQVKHSKYSLKSTKFYERIQNKLKNKNDMHFVSLDKNMRQQDGLKNYENFKEDLARYRDAVSKDNIGKCKECLKNIKDNVSNDLTKVNDDSLKNLTHCILTHSNNRALYIASILRKEGIPVYTRINDNDQFEYHEWIGKIFNFRCSHLSFKKFNELVDERNIDLPINYKGYDNENHTKTFYEYLNKEVLKQEPNYKIDKQELLRKICGEYTNDSIFKNVEKHNIEVSTIHKAKGREFDFVHIESGCCEDDPDYKKKFFEDNPNTYKSMYVALTRAKKFIDIAEFESLPRPHYLKDDNYYIKVAGKSKIKEYKILYKNIDLDSFKHYQKELQEIKLNDKIILIKNENDQWDIICNQIIIGQMKNINDRYKDENEMKQITGLRVDGIWSVFGKNKDTGNIDVWNVVSFCGFGDVKYE